MQLWLSSRYPTTAMSTRIYPNFEVICELHFGTTFNLLKLIDVPDALRLCDMFLIFIQDCLVLAYFPEVIRKYVHFSIMFLYRPP
jgi:hypothetical protein